MTCQGNFQKNPGGNSLPAPCLSAWGGTLKFNGTRTIGTSALMNSTTPEQDLPLGNSDFALLRQNNKIYVDKTTMVHQLAKGVGNKVFIARPRRFGKSLLVSTFESLFKYGLRDFQGLAIESQWTDTTYNVVRLDFSETKNFTTGAEFQKRIDSVLTLAFGNVGFAYAPDPLHTVCDQLSDWLSKYPKNSLVLLIDEYDAPLTACLDKPDLFEQVRSSLSDFYSRLKKNDGALRFLFITGITKYSKVSIFSELNNLNDITLDVEYGTLLGYTAEELGRYFGNYIARAAEVLELPPEELLARMRERYDGYCFDGQALSHVYSPWSTLMFLTKPRNGLENYWIESGGQTSLLMNFIKGHSLKDPDQYGRPQVIEKTRLSMSADVKTIDDVVLLTQAGYLTIKSAEDGAIVLGYPNWEVAQSMAKLYTSILLREKGLAEIGAAGVVRCLRDNDVDAFVGRLNKAFLAIDYTSYPVKDEYKCCAMAAVFLAGAGLSALSQTHNALGRSDIETVLGATRWVLEFKFARPGDDPEALLAEALSQAESRQYGAQSSETRLMHMGLVFSEDKRQFVAYGVREARTE